MNISNSMILIIGFNIVFVLVMIFWMKQGELGFLLAGIIWGFILGYLVGKGQ